MKQSIILVTVVLLLLSSCQNNTKVNFPFMNSVEYKKSNQEVEFSRTQELSNNILNELFLVTSNNIQANESRILYSQNGLYNFYTNGTDAYAFFHSYSGIDLQDMFTLTAEELKEKYEEMLPKDISLGSLYFFPQVGKKAFKLMEIPYDFSFSEDLNYLAIGSNIDDLDYDNRYKIKILSMPDQSILCEFDFYKEIDVTPPLNSFLTEYKFYEESQILKVVFSDHWNENYAEFDINLNDGTYKAIEIEYSKKLPEIPCDAVWVNPNSLSLSTQTIFHDRLKLIEYDLPYKDVLWISERTAKGEDFEEIIRFTDTQSFWFNEENETIIIIHGNIDKWGDNEITLYDFENKESITFGSGTYQSILTKNWKYFANLEIKDANSNNFIVNIYDLESLEKMQSIKISDYYKENFILNKVRFISFEGFDLSLLLYTESGEEYQLTVNLFTKQSSVIRVNQYEKPKLNLPAIK